MRHGVPIFLRSNLAEKKKCYGRRWNTSTNYLKLLTNITKTKYIKHAFSTGTSIFPEFNVKGKRSARLPCERQKLMNL